MPIELKFDKDKMLEDGIYFVDIDIRTEKFQATVEKIVYAPYEHDICISKVMAKFTNTDLGIKEKSNAKHIIHIKIRVIKYLSKVNADTFNQWKNSAENSKNNSIT